MSRHRTRRIRRTLRQVLKHGTSAKRRHVRIAGRTGAIHCKQTPPKTAPSGVSHSEPAGNPVPWATVAVRMGRR
jgi:hypothetical protein